MFRLVFNILIISTATFFSHFGAAAETKKIALLIGNQEYSSAIGGRLRNPHKDVELVAQGLRASGFEPVIKTEASRHEILRQIRSFVKKLNEAIPDAVGFFYYSGHGVARPDDHENFLIPVDVKALDNSDAWDDAVSLDEIMRLLNKAPNAAKIVVFDACRNELQLPTKGEAKGFSGMPQRYGGFMIAFATGPNEVAYDKGNAAGPYATALAAELSRPSDKTNYELFQNIRERVMKLTEGRQTPYELTGLNQKVIFEFVGDPAAEPSVVAHSDPNGPCRLYTSTTESISDAHTGPTVTVNVVLLDAYKGCYITKVDYEVIKQYNYSNYKISFENERKLARITYNLFDKPKPGYAKLDFKVYQAEIK